MLIAFGLFAGAVFRKHDDLKRVSLAVFFGIALISIPTYMTGAAAAAEIKGRPGVSESLVQAHEDVALFGFLFMEITGVVAWFGLWQYRRSGRIGKPILGAVLVLSMLSFAVMAQAANMGGDIRHPEISARQEGAAEPDASALPWYSSKSIGLWVTGTPWVWPASETIHFVGLCLLLGVVFLVNFRMLGIVKNISFSALHRLLPVGIIGYLINSVTGMLFFIGTPEQYIQNVAFYWKVLFMLMAGVSVLYFTVFDEPWSIGPGDDAPAAAKIIAASTIALWLGVMYMGRMLPYLGNSF